MRKPQTPPPEMMIKDAKDALEFWTDISKINSPLHKGEYIHWDKLRRLTPPNQLDHCRWWRAIKAVRNQIPKRQIHLVGHDGIPFHYSIVDPILEYLHLIDQDTSVQQLAGGELSNPEMRDRFIFSSLAEEAITSSQIEGAATTRKVAREMIRTGRQPRDTSEQMIMNNYRALEHLRVLKDQPLSVEGLLDLHRILTEKTLEDPSTAGRFRLPDELVNVVDITGEVFHAAPSTEGIEKRMEDLLKFANGQTPDYYIPPVIRAILLHFWLAFEHPFIDGNGRSARALFYWSMLRQGYGFYEFLSISHIIKKAKGQYELAFLYTETDDNDLTYFVIYHLEIIRRAIEQLRTYIARKMEETRNAEHLLRRTKGLNYRQIALLSHALRNPDAEYTFNSHQTSHRIVYETARRDLYDLVSKGFLDETKYGKKLFFHPSPQIQKIIKQREEK